MSKLTRILQEADPKLNIIAAKGGKKRAIFSQQSSLENDLYLLSMLDDISPVVDTMGICSTLLESSLILPLTKEQWELSKGIECVECHQEAFRIVNNRCPLCYRNKKEKQTQRREGLVKLTHSPHLSAGGRRRLKDYLGETINP